MPNKVTISKKIDKNTVVVVEAESASSVQVAMNDAMNAVNSVKKSK